MPDAAVHYQQVEATLRAAVQISGDPYLTEIASHLIEAGGKRLRPMLTVASAATASDGPVTIDAIRGGVSVELVHIGSLYHDDVMDEAEVRRQVSSVNARWGNLRAILAGDFLLARASEIASELGVEVAGLLARTIAELCRGQVGELQTMYDTSRTPEQYFPSIEGKTASLYSSACRIGGIVTEQGADRIDALTEFGRRYGMAFQVIDDVLDVVATDEQLGKPAGNDMIEGVYSLPVIFALQGSNGGQLRTLLEGGLTAENRQAAIDLVRESSGVPKALDCAAEMVTAAKAQLSTLGANQATEAMADAADHLLTTVPTFSA